MGTRSRADAKHLYSWWWDSHISPKNSKWLKESLKDMDTKVKQMIELAEVDEDSFASRAELYYANRPQLMKLLEDFYRGYRALAERYDHASGAIKQAHKSITEVFPNQVPPVSDDGPSSPVSYSHSCVPEKSVATQESRDLQELDYGDGNGPFGPVEALSPSRLGGLDYHDAFLGALKKAFGRAIEEKEAAEIQYQKYLEKIASLESEIVRLKDEVDRGTAKLKVAEEQCVLLEKSNKSMRGEIDLFSANLDAQNQELEGKQKEIGRLCTCLQEADTALKTLQSLQVQTQDELTSVAAELQERVEILKKMETQNQSLKDEVLNITQRKEKLEEMLDLQLEEKNTLQQEIHRLKDLQDENTKLKESHQLIKNEKSAVVVEKSVLLNERQAMKLKLRDAQERLEELGKIHEDLKQKYSVVEEQRESAIKQAEDLRSSLAAEKKVGEATVMAEMKNKISLLQDLNDRTRKQLEEELGKDANSQFEILNLKSTLHDLKETNSSLLKKCEKLLETSEVSEKLITELEHKNIEQDVELNILSEQINRLRMGMFQLLKALDVDLQFVREDELGDDQLILQRILVKFDATRNSLLRAWDENRTLAIEKSVLQALLGELKQEVADLKALISSMQREFNVGNDRLSSLQGDIQKLLRSHEELIPRVRQKNQKEEFFAIDAERLKANHENLEEKRSLTKAVSRLDEEKHKLEHENCCLAAEVVTLDMLSLIFKSNVLERSEIVRHLVEIMSKHIADKRLLEDKVRIMESKLNTEGSLLELLSASVQEAFLREKLYELIGEHKRVEEESHSKGLEIVHLRERVRLLESESGQMRAQLTGYLPALQSLQDSLASLQSHAIRTGAVSDQDKGTENPNKVAASDGISDLQDIAVRIKAVATGFIAMKRLQCPQCESIELLTKDIELDRASETSSHRMHRVLEQWETIDLTDSTDLMVERLPAEKELKVDKETSGSNRKILESLESDVRKLTELQKTVQDLKRRVAVAENSNSAKGKGNEYKQVKEHLEDTDKAITKLIDVDGRLMRDVEDSSSGEASASVSEQARRCSEKTGRLQLEVEKIQFLLMKTDDISATGRGNEIQVAEQNMDVALKDYFYGGNRSARKRKDYFCGCIRPSTNRD